MQFEKDGGAVGTWMMVQVSTLNVSIVILNEYLFALLRIFQRHHRSHVMFYVVIDNSS